MAHRIEVKTRISDTRAEARKDRLRSMGFDVDQVTLNDIYTVDAELEDSELEKVLSLLHNPVIQEASLIQQSPEAFDHAVEIGRLPGVTDNVGSTAREGIEARLKRLLGEGEDVYTSQLMFLEGNITEKDLSAIESIFSNPLIQRVERKSLEAYREARGMEVVVPKVTLEEKPTTDTVDLLVDDLELQRIGKAGIFDHFKELSQSKFEELRQDYAEDQLKLGDLVEREGKYYQKVRRGPLALDLKYMHTIQRYFGKLGRNPTDVELESIAQTWSEHCKHTIFADPIDEIKEGLFATYIKAATERIREELGDKDFCRSVFKDNGGIIDFDEFYDLVDKVETHNAPSRLDGEGGSGTGIGGVIRDILGTGKAAKTFALAYLFCLADMRRQHKLYRGPNQREPLESVLKNTLDIIRGVGNYGNQSGIPTTHGQVRFDERYAGKPLVFVRGSGIIPKDINGKPSYEKKANPGDYIVVVGGRTGRDGEHGATFSSEALDEGSPATAVQIGDAITQKKKNDALLEARDRELYSSITDNGAGGLSCSVGEMGKESGGAYVRLHKAPLKYQGMAPWSIWISEAQERMTLAVPPDKIEEFLELMARRKVEATVIGEFTDSGKCVVEYDGQTVMDLDMDFLHDGLPPRPMTTTYTRPVHEEPDFAQPDNLSQTLTDMLSRLNITSWEFISQQYDHEVQGGSVIKPLQGRGRVNGDAAVTKPVLNSPKAVVSSQGINPSYSDIDTYHMAASAIDTAIRNAIAAGANPDHLALEDNFCWCSSREPERLGQLKEAARACYDYAVAYKTPFISGKDSMFNDFEGFDEDGKEIKISVPPTLLISSISVMDDATKAVSLDAKIPGDLVYVLGETHDELGGSEYFAMIGEQERGEAYIGNNVPKVDAEKNSQLYRSYAKAVDDRLVASAQSVHIGGLAVALAKTALGGGLGMDISLENIPGTDSRYDFAMFSESQGRMVVTISPKNKEKFEAVMEGSPFAQIGTVTRGDVLTFKESRGMIMAQPSLFGLHDAYKETLKDY